MPRDTMTTARTAALLLGSLALFACGNQAPNAHAGHEHAAATAADVAANADAAPQDSPLVVVYKGPTCGCCSKWVDHMRAAGFRLEVHDVADVTPIKTQHGVTYDLQSCHTALVDGYVFEGHVPAEDIRRFLAERPDYAGLAVPGMPMGSPGMEGPVRQPYNVIAFIKDGKLKVFNRH